MGTEVILLYATSFSVLSEIGPRIPETQARASLLKSFTSLVCGHKCPPLD